MAKSPDYRGFPLQGTVIATLGVVLHSAIIALLKSEAFST